MLKNRPPRCVNSGSGPQPGPGLGPTDGEIARELGVAWGTRSAWVKHGEPDAGLRRYRLT